MGTFIGQVLSPKQQQYRRNPLLNRFAPSTTTTAAAAAAASPAANLHVTALMRLSENLGSIFNSSSSEQQLQHDFYADARIVLVDGRELAMHRCILAARSSFFRSVFAAGSSSSAAKDNKSGGNFGKVEMKELAKEYEVGVEAVGAVVGYLYSGRVMPLPRGACVCVDDDCSKY